jgi:hypothetical protein
MSVVPLPSLLFSKYSQLMTVVEDMGKYVKPCYSGGKTSVERLRKGKRIQKVTVFMWPHLFCVEIQQARMLTKECLTTLDLIGQQQDQQ